MNLPADLLEQAQHLARRERLRPKQASLRRAVSSAYYALFHLLIHDAAALLIANLDLRVRCSRLFEHGDMKQASKEFGANRPNAEQLQKLTGGPPIPAGVQQVAQTFLELQEERHEADYDLEKVFTRADVNRLVARTRQAFQQWNLIRTDPIALLYLAAMLPWKKRGR